MISYPSSGIKDLFDRDEVELFFKKMKSTTKKEAVAQLQKEIMNQKKSKSLYAVCIDDYNLVVLIKVERRNAKLIAVYDLWIFGEVLTTSENFAIMNET